MHTQLYTHAVMWFPATVYTSSQTEAEWALMQHVEILSFRKTIHKFADNMKCLVHNTSPIRSICSDFLCMCTHLFEFTYLTLSMHAHHGVVGLFGLSVPVP